MTPYHHTFHPVRRVDGRMVVADENQWLIIKNIHAVAAAYADEDNRKTLVIIGPEVFGDWDDHLVNATGDRLRWDTDEWRPYAGTGGAYLEIDDVRARLFHLIDQCPHVTFCIETDRPGEVGKMMSSSVCKNCGQRAGVAPKSKYCGDGRDKDHEHHYQNQIRPNLWLGVGPIKTQADADRLIPEALKVPAAVRYAVMEPREEIDLSHIRTDKDVHADVLRGVYTQWCDGGIDHPAAEQSFDGGPKLGWLIIRGGEEPMHPDHVRSLVKQGEAADVPCWLEWGEWKLNVGKTYGKIFGKPGSLFGTWETVCSTDRKCIGQKSYHAYPSDASGDFGECETLTKVGRDRSGSTLDGREWRMVPGAVK